MSAVIFDLSAIRNRTTSQRIYLLQESLVAALVRRDDAKASAARARKALFIADQEAERLADELTRYLSDAGISQPSGSTVMGCPRCTDDEPPPKAA